MQQKLDHIQNRYDNIFQKSEDQLSQLQQAVPLANEFNRLQSEFADWLKKAEQDLRNFDPSASVETQKAVQEVSIIRMLKIIPEGFSDLLTFH